MQVDLAFLNIHFRIRFNLYLGNCIKVGNVFEERFKLVWEICGSKLQKKWLS